jgi:acetylornithine deacetylase
MPIDNTLRRKIVASGKEGFADQVVFTRTLIRFPSIGSAQHAVQDLMFRAMRERGLEVDRFAIHETAISAHVGGAPVTAEHSRAPILVGIHRPEKETGHSLILQGHVDVVPTDPVDRWTHPPFDPVIDGDWLYFR